ncbi:Na+/H+ antiporter subunit E [Aureimonas populi]|uniref:Na+/H+ antiporter subunit E n=1 Tax=Aureimonas populi TaxID=1701758 RepID=A0ABW5CPD0_9HYPH|nr:Na+/H+ antiporter subunit E [Aureimonas populi]
MTVLRKLWFAALLAVRFLFDLTMSSIAVARVVLSPRAQVRPRFVSIPLASRSPLEVTLVANYITLTPGTLTVDVSTDARTLLIHDLSAGDDSASSRAGVTEGIEPRVLKVTR